MARVEEQRHGPDGGMSMIELLVAMVILVVVLSVSFVAVRSLVSTSVRAHNIGVATNDLRQSFLLMDRTLRYADAVNAPGYYPDSDRWYWEVRTAPITGGRSERCTQYRFLREPEGTGRLQSRTWAENGGGTGETPITPGNAPWRTLASGVDYDVTGTDPFIVQPVDASHPHQRLTVTLGKSVGEGRERGRAEITTDFVARNSSSDSPSVVCLSYASTRVTGLEP